MDSRKKHYLAVLFLFVVISVVAGYFAVKPSFLEVTDVAYNISPTEGIYNKANLKFVSPEKRWRVYIYRLRFNTKVNLRMKLDFDSEKYLAEHPGDVVLVQHENSGRYLVEIFTDEIDRNIFTISPISKKIGDFYFKGGVCLKISERS